MGEHGDPQDRPEPEDAPADDVDVELEVDLPRPRIAASALRAATASIGAELEDADDGADGDGDVSGEVVGTHGSGGDAVPDDAMPDDAMPDDAVPDDAMPDDDEDGQAWRALPLGTRLEALLFAAPSPLTLRRLQSLAGDVDAADVRDALDALAAHYAATSRAFGLEEIGGGYQLRTRAELSGLLARLGRKRAAEKLTPAALETLAIVAYRQPVLRADVEKIRGVASGEVLRTLVEKGLVRVAGRADLPGAPLLYGTTPTFLELFGLRDLRDLPTDRELLRTS